jgi:Uma2 family endonuclease
MAAIPQFTSMSEAEYLAFERQSETKHEFLNGELFAMAGGSENHVLVSGNVFAAFHAQFRGRDCRVYNSDMRVQVRESGLYTYPDVTAICGDPEFLDETRDTLLNPTVIVEVLSPSTQQRDKTWKFEHYEALPSLQDYLVVAQDRVHVRHYHRQQALQWLLTTRITLDDVVDLPSVGCTLHLSGVYEKVTLA